jgi:ankyrin repeat protein
MAGVKHQGNHVLMNSDEKPTLFRPGVGKAGMNELHYAAYCGNLEALGRQLDAGADPNIRDEYRGYTAVHWLADMAATGGPRVQMLNRLVEKGANLNLVSESGDTAVGLAREAGTAGSELLEQELLKLGADPVANDV